MKNPFKKSSIVDTVLNVGIGGAANVAMDYVFSQFLSDQKWLTENVKNAIKIGAGAIGGSMVSGKAARYVRPALDGIATVGASNLISGLINDTDDETNKNTSGLPEGTIGRIRLGQRGFARRARVAGVAGADFMSC